MDDMHGRRTDPAGDRRITRLGMWAMWFCIAVAVLVLLTFFFFGQ